MKCGFSDLSRVLLLSLCCYAAAPSRTIVVNQKHPRASDRNPGTTALPLKTISAAAAMAQPGDTVLVREGVYRERVAPARGGIEGKPITYAAAPGEQVYVKGSERWQPKWQAVPGRPGVWFGRLDPKLFGEFNPFHLDVNLIAAAPGSRKQIPRKVRPTPEAARLPQTRGQIFVDSAPLAQAESLEEVYGTPGSWLVNAAGDGIWIHFPPDPAGREPAQRLVEITARSRIFGSVQRGLGYIHVRGFIFEHAANNHPTPQVGAVSTRSGHHWVIENNVIRYATTIGLEAGMEWGIGYTDEDATVPPDYVPGFHRIQNNHISDNGLCGLAALGHVGLQVIGNVIERNNRLAFKTWEVGGIKFHFAYYALVEGNLVRDNDGFGIWVDNTFYKCRITRNVILNNYWAGIFPELAEGPLLIDNNIIAYTRHGDGIYAHDASGFTVAHNLIYSNANYGIWTTVATDRKHRTGPVTASHQRFYNNLIFANHAGAIGLPFPFERAQDNHSDANLFVGGGAMDAQSAGPAPFFRYHLSGGRAPRQQMEQHLAEALRGLGPDQQPNLAHWFQRPDLTLEQWRAASGNDRNSLVARLRDEMLGLHALELRFNTMTAGKDARPVAELWQLRTIPVAGVEEDFYGNPIPKEGALPGPFQNVLQGMNRWLLWPAKPLWKGYPLEPGETPQVQDTFNERVRISHGCAQPRP
jgi:parallel beta-helix repeat protein